MSNLESICLTCLSDENSLEDVYLPLIAEEHRHVSLLDALKSCVPSQIIFSDNIPNKICDKCKNLLKISYSFQLQVLRSHEKLNELKQQESIKIKLELGELKLENDAEDTKEELFTDDDNDGSHNDDYELCSEPLKTEDENIENVLLNKQTYLCDRCTKVYYSKEEFDIHLCVLENRRPCPICNKLLKNESYEKHYKKHIKKFECNICLKQFKNEKLLLKHNLKHVEIEEVKTNKEVLKCERCELSFTNIRLLNTHLRRHELERLKCIFQCDMCEKEFSTKSILRRHVKLHSKDKKYKCIKCPKSYSRRDQLTDHLNTHDGVKPNVCSYCNKAFSQLCNLKDHIRTHTGETPFLCSECGKGFNNSSNLRQHIIRHTGVKPFSCILCPKTFCTKGQMTKHMISHTGAQPFKCEECGAGFTMPSSLKKHKMIHLGVKAFECDTCSRRFVNKDHLKRHYRTHTGEKPFQCKFCERSFAQSNDLIKHTRLHVGQNIYECTVCLAKFRLKSELKQHYPIHYVSNETPIFLNIGQKYLSPVAVPKDNNKITQNEDNTITISYNDILGKNGNITENITININGDKVD